MDLKEIQIDKSSPVPLYEQLRQGLMDAIVSGRLPMGSKMPTEEEICHAFSISRPVARQAYSRLIESGYVSRSRGRGSFVKLPDVRDSLMNTSFDFSEEMRKHGLEPMTRLLKLETITYDAKVYENLKLEDGDICWHMCRLRSVNNRPYVYLENWIPDWIVKDLDHYDLNSRSLYEVLHTEYKIQIIRTRRALMAQTASVEIAALLDRWKGTPVMYVENLAFDQHDRPADYCEEYYDGQVHKFEFDVYNR